VVLFFRQQHSLMAGTPASLEVDVGRFSWQRNQDDDDEDILGAVQSPSALDYSGSESATLQEAANRDLWTNFALSAGLGAAQAGIGAISTAQDKQNKEQLAELERRKDAGELGFDAEEQQLMERMQLDPVRSIATQQTREREAMQASMGDARSAADLARIDANVQKGVQEQFRKAGLEIAKGSLDEKRRELQELEGRIAYKGQRQQQRIDSVTQALAGIGTGMGQVMAGRAVPKLDIEKLKDAGFENEQITALVAQAADADTPAKISRMNRLLGNYMAEPEDAQSVGRNRRRRQTVGDRAQPEPRTGEWYRTISDTNLGKEPRRANKIYNDLRGSGLSQEQIATFMGEIGNLPIAEQDTEIERILKG
jgi:hypothetical protein